MKHKNILLIEDNPDDVELTLRAFKESKIANEIKVLKDGAKALDYLNCTGKYSGRSKEELPAIILLDLKLPKIDGLEVLKYIRSNEKTNLIPVVILTSSSEELDLINGYKLGCNSYIRKPVDFDEFIKVVKELGLYWLVINELPPRR